MFEEFKLLFRKSKFSYLWFSQIFCEFTINIMNFVLLVKLFTSTGSTVAASLIYLSYALPAIFVGPFAAATVDMFDRRKILMIANFFQSAAVLGYAFIPHISPFLLYSLAFTYSLLNQFYVPAQAASLPSLVPKKYLPQANSLFFLTQQSSIAIGFGIAGFLNHLLGFKSTLLLCGGFLFMAFVSSSLLPEMKVQEGKKSDVESAVRGFFERILEGYNFIKSHRNILTPFLTFLGLQVTLVVVMVNIPAISDDILRINANSAGVVVVTPGAIGALIGAIALPKLLRDGIRKKRIIEASFFFLALVLFTLALGVPNLGHFQRLLSGMILIFISGIAFTGILIPVQTFLQESTPHDLFGRVFGNMWFLVTIVTIFPVFFSGAITDVFGIRSLLLFFSLGMVAVAFLSKKYGQKFIEG